MARAPRLNINLYKVITGVCFSLFWASVMYMVWEQPSYLTFVWFYLGLGSIVLKWVIFEFIDRIHMKLRLRTIGKEIEQSRTRVREATPDRHGAVSQPLAVNVMTCVGCEEEFKRIQQEVSSLARMVDIAFERAIGSLRNRDIKLARAVIDGDQEIDLKQSAIRDYCMQVIATTCPKAEDLGMIVAVLGIIIDLERMGDYAEGIAKIALMLGDQRLPALPDGFAAMALKGREMLRGSLESFLEKDVDKAVRVFKMDDQVDKLHGDIFRELVQSMIKDPKTITRAIWLVWVAHNLERFADRVTNICEWVVFNAGGEPVNMGSSL